MPKKNKPEFEFTIGKKSVSPLDYMKHLFKLIESPVDYMTECLDIHLSDVQKLNDARWSLYWQIRKMEKDD